MAQGVIIGATNRSMPGLNNTLCLSPALIATKDDIDHITERHRRRADPRLRLIRFAM
jgi:adenosylmethionine-8-amino-7-oxononanoate aminotransferase